VLWAFVFAALFAAALTAMVRVTGLLVRRETQQPWPLVYPSIFVTLAITAWWFVTRGEPSERMVNMTVLPSPVQVLQAFPGLHRNEGLVQSTLVSFLRVNVGFLLAMLLAVPLGVYMATFPAIAAFFKPLSLIGAYVPTVVFIPLTIAWWGTDESQKVGFLAVGCFVALLPLVIKAIADVPAAYLDVAVTKGATQWQLVRDVLVPVAAADIWEHLRGVYGVGFGWIIMAELIGADKGLGKLLHVCDLKSRPGYFAVIIVIVVLAFGCDQAWRAGGRLLFPYRQRS
jgi:NitT/TauT family transport system permease protein